MKARKRTTARAVVVALTLLVAGCDDGRRAISRDDLPSVPATPDLVVVVDGNGFHVDGEAVEALTVTVATQLRFEVVGEARDIRQGTRSLTGTLFPGESTVVYFDEPGTYTIGDDLPPDHELVVTSVDVPEDTG